MAKKKYIKGNEPMGTKVEQNNPEIKDEQAQVPAAENIDANVEGNEADVPASEDNVAEPINEDTPADAADIIDEENTNPEIDAPADAEPTDDANAPVEPTVEPTPEDLPEDNIKDEDTITPADESLKDIATPALTGQGIDEPAVEVMEFTRKNIVDTIVYGEDELTIVRTLLLSAKAKFKESNIVTRLLDAIETYLVTPASASKGGALIQTYAIEFNKAEKGDLTNLAIFMLTKLTGKETEQRGLKSLSLASIVNTTRLVEDKEVKQESLKLVDAFAELHSAEERKKKIDVLISLNKVFNVNPRYLNANAVEILKTYFAK